MFYLLDNEFLIWPLFSNGNIFLKKKLLALNFLVKTKQFWKLFWVDNWYDRYTGPLNSATARLSLTVTLNSTWRLTWLRFMDMDSSSEGSKKKKV